MSKANRIKTKQRRAHRVLKENQELEARALIEDLDEEGGAQAPASSPDEPEALSKEYGEAESMYVGPTSFEEMDAMHEAHEQAMHVQEVTWNVQDLVRNILGSPMEAKEKSAKIQKVAGEFEKRVEMAMSMPMKKDIDLLQVEALIAIDARHTSPLQKAADFVKEKLSSGAREALSDDDFALPSKRKYPIHDKAHVRAALQRAAQMMKRGGEMAADAKAAMPKIRAAAKKMGIEMDMEKSAILIEKDAKGDWRWIGRPANNFIDWQGDIVEKAAHANYITWLDANPDMAPAFVPWHTTARRAHDVDFWMEKDGALIMSGVLTEDEAAALFEVQKDVDLGMSYQALGMRLDPDDKRVVTHYWMYEVSDLPLEKAANPFTTLETMTKEVGMDKLEYLTKIMGSEEKAKAYLEKTGQMQKQLAEAGITSKEKEADSAQTAAGEEKPAEVLESKAEASIDVQAIMDQVAKEFDIEGLNAFVAQAQEDHEKVGTLEELVKSLQTSTDEKLAEMLEPPAARFAWSKAARPSEQEGTKLKKDAEDDKLSTAAPGVPEGYWLSEISKSAPVSQLD